MSDARWIVNGRHEVIEIKSAALREERQEVGNHYVQRWYVDNQPGWFHKGQNLFDNEEDAKLRAIERVLGYALEHEVPVRQEYVRTACAYAKELRERIKELEREVRAVKAAGMMGYAAVEAERDHAREGWKEAVQWLCRLPGAGRESMPYWEKEEPWLFEETETP